jgi:ribonuclease HII
MLAKQFQNNLLECGTDEAGRGCLAGPVTAAAVILHEDFANEALKDSKLMSLKNRDKLRELILSEAISVKFCHVMMEEIDEINILNASILAMQRSIQQLQPKPEFILVDGNRFKAFDNTPFQCIVKGDNKFLSIAAASVIAKTERDAFMQRIHEEYPMYKWNKNKGYPTKEHRDAIRKHGITKYHRRSFRLLPEQLSLFPENK